MKNQKDISHKSHKIWLISILIILVAGICGGLLLIKIFRITNTIAFENVVVSTGSMVVSGKAETGDITGDETREQEEATTDFEEDIIEAVIEDRIEDNRKSVAIDSGHGGRDPGKIGVNGAYESEINYKIAWELKSLLEEQDVQVVWIEQPETVWSDEERDPEELTEKDMDMYRRLSVIEEAKPDIVVSIHQNSYKRESVRGATVFYYTESKAGKKLADTIQKQIIKTTEQKKERYILGYDYFLLKNVTVPIVIVECGFLSNRKEAELLVSEDYQQKMAMGIYNGIMDYFEEEE